MTKGRHSAGRVHSHAGRHHKVEHSTIATAAVVSAAALATTIPFAPAAFADGGGTNWDAVAQCESGGRWNTNTGNGFHGGLQFTPSTWRANGGQGAPENASRAEQIRVAENVKRTQGMGAWPVCGRHAFDGGSRQWTAPVVHRSAAPRHAAPVVPLVRHEQPAPAPKPAAPQAPDQQQVPDPLPGDAEAGLDTVPARYVVQPGDTLWGIAAEHHMENTGSTPAWRRISDANHLDNPDIIHPGQILKLPQN